MLTISILNYRNWNETAQCVRDLVAACRHLEYRILVRDNSETSEVTTLQDELLDIVAPLFYFESPDNPGFAGGHNSNFRAVEHRPSDIFLVMNNDIRIPDADVVKSMLQAIGPQRLVSCVIQTSERGDMWFSGGTIGRVTGDLSADRRPFASSQRSSAFLTGCCLMVPAHLYESLGGFDERFFMYVEDLDFCLRARSVGAELIVVKQHIVHKVGSGEKGFYSDTYLYWNTRNRLILLREHGLGKAPLSLAYYFLKYGFARTIQLAVRSQRPARQIDMVWRGLWDGFFRAWQYGTGDKADAHEWHAGIERF
jgi:GT2 family glycosyltransferase